MKQVWEHGVVLSSSACWLWLFCPMNSNRDFHFSLLLQDLPQGSVTWESPPAVFHSPSFWLFPRIHGFQAWDGRSKTNSKPLSITRELAKWKAVKWHELTPLAILASAGHVSLHPLPQRVEHKNHQSRQSLQSSAGNCPKAEHCNGRKATVNWKPGAMQFVSVLHLVFYL